MEDALSLALTLGIAAALTLAVLVWGRTPPATVPVPVRPPLRGDDPR